MASVIYIIIIIGTGFALEVVELSAAFDLAFVSFQLEVRKTICALSSLISDASCRNRLADAIGSQEVSAITSNTFIVVVGLAVIDFTVSIVEFEGFVALVTNMIDFMFAAKNGIHNTDVIVEAVATLAGCTDLSSWVLEVLTVFNCWKTS